MKGLKTFFSECEKEDFRYFAVLCSDIGSYLGTFIRPARLRCSVHLHIKPTISPPQPRLSRYLPQSDSSVRDFLERLDGTRIAVRINSGSAAGFAASASVIRHLRTVIPLYRNLLNSLDINALASAASSAQPGPVPGLG